MSTKAYYEAEHGKLVIDYQQIRNFTSHPGALGSFRESRLREYLRLHLPGVFTISSGFILDVTDGSTVIHDRSSKQIDCLVFDGHNFAPLLSTPDFACVHPEAIVAVIEVKSKLTLHRQFGPHTGQPNEEFPFKYGKRIFRWSGTLLDAIENIKAANRLMHAPDNPVPQEHFAGIFSYDCQGLQQLRDVSILRQIFQQAGITHLSDLPSDICALNGGWWGFSAYSLRSRQNNFTTGKAYMNHVPSTSDQIAAPLQCFTAVFSTICRLRIAREKHRTGGLRSAQGAFQKKSSRAFPLNVDGYGP